MKIKIDGMTWMDGSGSAPRAAPRHPAPLARRLSSLFCCLSRKKGRPGRLPPPSREGGVIGAFGETKGERERGAPGSSPPLPPPRARAGRPRPSLASIPPRSCDHGAHGGSARGLVRPVSGGRAGEWIGGRGKTRRRWGRRFRVLSGVHSGARRSVAPRRPAREPPAANRAAHYVKLRLVKVHAGGLGARRAKARGRGGGEARQRGGTPLSHRLTPPLSRRSSRPCSSLPNAPPRARPHLPLTPSPPPPFTGPEAHR